MVSLSLAGMSPGIYTLPFELFLIRSWDGNDTTVV
jgi:hypothetical protein